MNYENYDPYFPDQPVVDLYLPVLATLPAFRSKPAFVWAADGEKLTYSQLNSSANSISAKLLYQLKRGDTVAVLCSPGLELVEVVFGCQRAGLLSVPVRPPHRSFAREDRHHLVRVLSQTNPRAAIAGSSYIKAVKQYVSSPVADKRICMLLQGLTWISTDDFKSEKEENISSSSSSSSDDDSIPYQGCRPEELYLVQFTSGATGIPKPVLVTAGAAAHNVRAARKAYDLYANSVICSWLPQYHDCGLMFLLLTIVSCATCVLTSPDAFVNRPRLWLEMITEYKATCTPVPSFALPLVLKRGGIDKGTIPINLWTLKNLIIINEPIYKDSVDEFVAAFRPFGLNPACISPSYGLAENCTFVSTSWRNNGEFSSFPNIPSYKKLLPSARLASIGIEEEEIDIIVVNEETKEPVDDGVEGEIWISSPSNASGYLHHPSLTRYVFRGRLSNKLSRCFVRTGDTGIVLGDERFLFVTGRSSDVIELQEGGRIHPHYVETAAYRSCQKLLRGGCLAAFKFLRTMVVVAEMQSTREEEDEDQVMLKIICEGIRESVMREEKVGVGLVVLVKVGCIPKTTSGKIQRWASKDKLIGGKMEVIMEMQFEEKQCEEKGNNVISLCRDATQVGSRSFL